MSDSEEEEADRIRKGLAQCNSGERLQFLLMKTAEASDSVFWDVFCSQWRLCDTTWGWNPVLIETLRARRQPNFLPSKIGSAENRKFFQALPDPVVVYRGCSPGRVMGASWTSDPEVARSFARRLLDIRVPDPVIAESRIAKDAIFAVFQERNESEIVLNTNEVEDLEITPLGKLDKPER